MPLKSNIKGGTQFWVVNPNLRLLSAVNRLPRRPRMRKPPRLTPDAEVERARRRRERERQARSHRVPIGYFIGSPIGLGLLREFTHAAGPNGGMLLLALTFLHDAVDGKTWESVLSLASRTIFRFTPYTARSAIRSCEKAGLISTVRRNRTTYLYLDAESKGNAHIPRPIYVDWIQAVHDAAGAPGVMVALLLAYTRWVNKQPTAPLTPENAEYLGLKRSTVARALKALEAAGFISKVPGHRREFALGGEHPWPGTSAPSDDEIHADFVRRQLEGQS